MTTTKKFLKNLIIILFLILIVGIIVLFVKNSQKQNAALETKTPKIMKITSPVFQNNSYLLAKYTCDGENINPPLQIEEMPTGTQSLILIVDDPDAPGGTFLHWLVWNINPDTSVIEENSLPLGAKQGRNDFGKNNYSGPCPPSGIHRYFFKIYALDKKLDLPEGANLNQIHQAIQDHLLDEAQLVGLYQRK